MRNYLAFLLMLASSAHAAVWERPAGAYTPTNHSVNVTKYQIDSANGTAISSAKVDGDINKAFEGLNDLDSRVPPSVVGKTGQFLTNNGSAAFWTTLASDTIVSGSTSVVAGASTVSITAGGLTSYFFSGGLVGNVSASAVTASVVVASQVSASAISGSAIQGISVTAGLVSATTTSGTYHYGQYASFTNISVGTGLVARHRVFLNTSSSGCTIVATSGIPATSCARRAQGEYDVSVTTAFATASYRAICSASGSAATFWLAGHKPVSASTAGYIVKTMDFSGGTPEFNDANYVDCVVFY